MSSFKLCFDQPFLKDRLAPTRGLPHPPPGLHSFHLGFPYPPPQLGQSRPFALHLSPDSVDSPDRPRGLRIFHDRQEEKDGCEEKEKDGEPGLLGFLLGGAHASYSRIKESSPPGLVRATGKGVD